MKMDYRTRLKNRCVVQLEDRNENPLSNRNEDDEEEEDNWKNLPDILLEDIFHLLSIRHRHEASQVCKRWYETFYAPRVWTTFTLLERTFTRRIFNLYKGYQRELCPRKTQVCLLRVGPLFKKIIVTPISNFYSLYEFLRILNSFFEFHDDFPMPLLRTFDFTFFCETRGITGTIVHGTGGKILDILKMLLSNMQNLKHLKLNQLLLDVVEVSGLLEAVATHCRDSLATLELLNCSKIPFPMTDISQFTNLSGLSLSAQHIDEEVLVLIGGIGLHHLHIVQDPYTCPTEHVSAEAWRLLKEMAPHLRVILEVRGFRKIELIIQPHAPVYGVFFSTPYSKISPELAVSMAEYYQKTLQVFKQTRLPRVHGSRSFHERGDSSFLLLVRQCPLLRTLIISERISTATLLLLAKEGKNLKTLIVRQNALIKKCDWPKSRDWSKEFYHWLKANAGSYELTTKEVSQILGHPWKPLRDEAFKHL